jgi:hypothetical protein
MKITRNELKALIEEELKIVLSELNPYHDKHTGKLSSAKTGNSYSLSEPAVRAAGWDKEKAKKGEVTGKGNVSYKFGMSGEKKGCGRKSVSGKKIPKKFRCSNYPEKYDEKMDHPLVPSSDDAHSDRLDKLGYPKHLLALGKGIIRADEATGQDELYVSLNDLMSMIRKLEAVETSSISVQEGNQDDLIRKCRQIGFTTSKEAFQNIARSLNTLKRAEAGKLFEPTSKQ